ncbi:cytochrome C biogenesis protein ResB [Pandoraea terrae]|uniref:Cytochrome C biogenesis protein ResB n=1 Tax=Pandoraea terrae TaxID=1537710 RepID=A0A5E4V9S8_9BURK|nr:cytochrome c biogenesis protein ResB [Pandoraea terrae]VVE09037.1 cytochrome C biogenesis protein ResB [Pandoraea terrae]
MSGRIRGMAMNSRRDFLRDELELLSSMRFAISLLCLLAIASVIGTVISQGQPYPNYVNQFGPFWAEIFRALGLFNVYGAWWFLLILGFLVVSTSLCVIRNTPRIVTDIRSWKDHVRERSLHAFHHKAEFGTDQARTDVARRLSQHIGHQGFRLVIREHEGATLIAARAGMANKLGYVLAHVAIVVICLGGLLDSNLIIRLQMALLGKSPVMDNPLIDSIGPEHRLSLANPTFRGNAFVPEGGEVSTAILDVNDGSLIQDLPFSIQLKKFRVEYYSTGMPRLFASDIVVIDHATGKRIPAIVKVNQPLVYRGISIYQSGFDDGGSKLKVTAFPMQGSGGATFGLNGEVGTAVRPSQALHAPYTVEFTDFRPINVENIANAQAKPGSGALPRNSLPAALNRQLGSGARPGEAKDLRNIGPSFQYKVRDVSGQANEYKNYMLPVQLDGESVFLSGMRDTPDGPFHYLRIPAGADGTVNQWMMLRAALFNPEFRAEAASRFARAAMPNESPTQTQDQLMQSAARTLAIFAGVASDQAGNGSPGGFQAVAEFVAHTLPQAAQDKAAELMVRVLEGTAWQLWQIARAQAGQPPAAVTPENSRFVRSALNALSDNFYYGAPVYLRLDAFHQVQASVFQLTRSPGKVIVYVGSVLLVLGIFSMFYVRQRRLWVWIKDRDSGSTVLMAMSTTRRTLDFEREFNRLRGRFPALLASSSQG